jgi:hypothetical protein
MFLRSRGRLLRGLMSLLGRIGEGCLRFVEVGLMSRLLRGGSVVFEHLTATI